MPFLTTEKRTVPASGPPTAKIAFVGEAPGAVEERKGEPFVGPAGTILEQCMHSAQLIRAECYFTNVVQERPPNNDIKPFFNGKVFTEAGQLWVTTLKEQLSQLKANVIVAVGTTALAALCGQTQIMKRRGYVHESTLLPGRKVLPIIHPSAALRGNYLYRYYITRDLRKAKLESATPEFQYPDRQLCIPETYIDAIAALDGLMGKSPLSCDIEVANDEVSCIGFCHDPTYPVTIPFYHAWQEQDEAGLWILIAKLLEDQTTTKIFQNAAFDIPFLLQQNHILVRGPIEDTMIAHSVTYPEFLKGLEFLGSIYSNQPYWKDLAKAGGHKREE